MTMKKYYGISIICLVLCLALGGCGLLPGKTTIDPDDTDSRISVVIGDEGSHDILKPSNPKPVQTEPVDTEPQDSETDPTTEPPPVTEPVPDTEPAPDTSEVPPEDEPQIPDDFEPTAGTIDLRGKLAVDYPVSGKFVSIQSDRIKLIVNYTCNMLIDGSVTIDLDVGLEVFNINCGARIDMGKITVNGETHKYSTDALSKNDHRRGYIPFTSFTHQSTSLQNSTSVEVIWPFNGYYGDVHIKDLTASALFMWD